MKKINLTLLLLIVMTTISAQEKIMLYPQGPQESNELKEPESWRDKDFLRNISEPRILVFSAKEEVANGTAVLICPGGGYSGVSVVKEGEDIAKWFNARGVTAFVLYYRMPNGHHDIPLKDAQTAMKYIRKTAKKWNINKQKIGVMGFSAGGHLVATLATHNSRKTRPDFAMLIYPVITMDKEFTHKGSRDNLLGKNPSTDQIRIYSNELQVSKKTPPTFIVHAKDDQSVPIKNSQVFYDALIQNNIPAELNIYNQGGHGFGMREKGVDSDSWSQKLEKWLIKQKIIDSRQ
ncbi:MAG: alpha/beta hydrolase [Paludibacteraceae bacterium]